MGRIRLVRIKFGSSKNKSRTVKIHKGGSKKGNQHRCPSCGRYM